MTRIGTAAVCGICAATMLWAQESTTPLAAAKEQLRSLKKDQTAEATGLANPNLRSILPALEVAPPRTAPVVTPARPDPVQKASTLTDARRNWLLDGFEQTEHQAVGATPADRTGVTGEIAEEKLDPADPNYSFKVYERRRSGRLADRQEKSSAAARIPNGQNPFAPLMQEWLAGSPVRETLDDILRPKSTQSTAIDFTGGGNRVSSRASTTANLPIGTLGLANPDREVANPYLDAFDLSTRSAVGLSELRVPAIIPAPTVLPQSATTNQFTLPQLPKVESRRSGPPGQTDDKKYFPQLKKF